MSGARSVSGAPSVGVVVLAYGDEPWLAACVDAVRSSREVRVDLVVVDNGCRPADLAPVRERGVRVVDPGRNTGFAGGCDLGAHHVTGELLALVNSDCLVEPDTLAALAAQARDPGTGPVMASIRLAERPDLLNSGGNPVHVLGTCWAGGIGQPETRTAAYDVTSASGACLLLRRGLWDRLGGFDETYFAYLEDTELSLRCRRIGLVPRCVPTARALHHYEFSRNPRKMYLLERNRLLLVTTLWSGRALLLLAPLLLALEVALLLLATAQGWRREKVEGWRWLLGHRGYLRTRRRTLAAERLVAQREWLAALTPELDPHVVGSAAVARAVNAAVGGYWRLVRSLL